MSAHLNAQQHAARRWLYDAGLTDGEIADRENVSKRSVWSWRKTHNLPVKNPTNARLTGAQHLRRLELYRSGWNDREIATDSGVREPAIKKWRMRHGLQAQKWRSL